MVAVDTPISWHAADWQPAPEGRLGDRLVAKGLLTQAQLGAALAEQRRIGVPLGEVLVARGFVRRLDVYRVLGEQWGLPYADLTVDPIDPTFGSLVDRHTCARDQWLPLRREADGSVVVAVARKPDAELDREIRAQLYAPHAAIRYMATSSWDIARGLARAYEGPILQEAAEGLANARPEFSARRVLSLPQVVAVLLLLGALTAGLVLWTTQTLIALIALVNLGYSAGILFRFGTALAGLRFEHHEVVSDEQVAALTDDELPAYTVLVPLFREANVIAGLMENLGRLDYPPERLEVLLLLEEDDTETIEAARALRPPDTVQFVIVPSGVPQTKPKACNVGLFFARGDYCVIYDAEDRPDPDQLKKAYAAFKAGGPELVCVQAALNYFNAEENALTRMFTLEYSYWFDYLLPGLDALRLPIPLGGTSNHFDTAMLRRLGGWDPFNVTEDADLGIRAAAEGMTVGVVNSTTYEEANARVGNWIRQRSRWIKGYLQTALVHLRHPIRLVREAGLKQTLAFAVLVGGTPLTFLCGPPMWALFAYWVVTGSSAIDTLFPTVVLWLSFFNLLIGNGVMVYLSMMGGFKRGRYKLVLWAMLNPLYWVLHSIAAYKALWQLILKPHYWEKTEHGITSYVDGAPTLAGAYAVAGAGAHAG
jgi:hypothetical protein